MAGPPMFPDMPLLPPGLNGRIAWFERHVSGAEGWIARAAELGLDPARAAELGALVEEARARNREARAARAAARDATLRQTAAVARMLAQGSAAIATIKSHAQTTANPTVYARASIRPAAPRAPRGTPAPPTDLTAAPSADGSVTLTWKGPLAGSTFFTVWRRTPSAPSIPEQLVSLASRTFVDTTLPSGLPNARYFVRAQRGVLISAPSPEVVVNFGASSQAASRAVAA